MSKAAEVRKGKEETEEVHRPTALTIALLVLSIPKAPNGLALLKSSARLGGGGGADSCMKTSVKSALKTRMARHE